MAFSSTFQSDLPISEEVGTAIPSFHEIDSATSTDLSDDFMFVNESGHLDAYKPGRRPDIRDHITKYRLRRHQREHQIPTIRRQWTLLAREEPQSSFETAAESKKVMVNVSQVSFSPDTNYVENRENLQRQRKKLIHRFLRPDPVEVLGAGRIDPFLSLPVDNADNSLHELIDYGKIAPTLLLHSSYQSPLSHLQWSHTISLGFFQK